ncbi:uncharacterized protein LOC141621029 [Silene latifolia]|uniref:uncharacterized protein LOC141621029 n=1 Tax=Silene latifolia TaxID=37657 RepID=UPI003D773C86
MAESNSSFTQKITPNSPKLEEFNSSLRIKLKLPKTEHDYLQKNNILINSASNNRENNEERHEDDLDDKVIEEENVVNLRICEICNKTFNSGKALGGHKRVHAPNYKANKKVVPTTMGSTSRSNSMSSPEVAETGETHQSVFKCDLCPKEFRSLKSLFGHMRSHPDRLWRGMNPPQQYLAAEEFDSSAAEARLRCLGSWRVTGKRGRKGLCSSSSPVGSSSSSFGSHAEAAADLMLLLAGRGGTRDRNDCFADDEDEDVIRANKKGKGLMVINNNNNNNNNNDGDEDETRLFDEDEIYYLKNLGFLPNYKVNDDDDGVIRVHNNLIINNFDNQVESSTPKIKGINKKVAKINHKTINYHSELIELNHHYSNPIENNNVNKFGCTTCGKSFSTYQALGGHRSSHNKDKSRPGVDASGLTDTGYSEDGQGQGQGQDDVEAVVIGEHKCELCERTFTSGQALGGHKRSHYVVPVTDNISSSPGQTSYQTGWNRNLEDFDLNDVPPMMNANNDDDDDVGDVTFDSN